ncbi:pleiotropic drug resistance protein 1-like [Primulina eburnea]|uniref:pleiotropic drug resistance protein 1-like n=1 Tax=Primulina eburnea TaxID=1245227 RepID=UPI003C6CBA1B
MLTVCVKRMKSYPVGKSGVTDTVVTTLLETLDVNNFSSQLPRPTICSMILSSSDGQIVYHGPRENVVGFFESMGFKCPKRKGVADLLQEVTSKKDQKQYWARKDEPYRFITVNEFAEAFQSYADGERLGDELVNPYDKSKSHPAALSKDKYGVGQKELLKACKGREYLLMKGNGGCDIKTSSMQIHGHLLCF